MRDQKSVHLFWLALDVTDSELAPCVLHFIVLFQEPNREIRELLAFDVEDVDVAGIHPDEQVVVIRFVRGQERSNVHA